MVHAARAFLCVATCVTAVLAQKESALKDFSPEQVAMLHAEMESMQEVRTLPRDPHCPEPHVSNPAVVVCGHAEDGRKHLQGMNHVAGNRHFTVSI